MKTYYAELTSLGTPPSLQFETDEEAVKYYRKNYSYLLVVYRGKTEDELEFECIWERGK